MTIQPTSAGKSESLVSVLVLLRNDAAILRDFIQELQGVLQPRYAFFEILFVDLQSSDDSLAILRELMESTPNLRVIRLSNRADAEIGMAAALDHCIGDHAILMNMYLDRPADIPRLVAAAETGYDVVIAQRQGAPRGRFGRRLFYKIASFTLKKELDPDESDFRLMTRKVVASLTKIKNRRRHIRYFTALMGFKKLVISSTTHARAARMPRGRGFFPALRRSLDMLISHSATPLRFTSGLGVLASFGNLVYLLYVLAVALIKEHLAEGWLTTSVMMSTMFFCLFVMLSVLAEYVARILEETQDRPLYFIEFEAESTVARHRTQEMLNIIEST